ncbi:uncharacterized protein F4817DRAFT_310986 [Daldinia loculata]|uniref:uncharacterized protein n=1 Tax=Daldinia loculata TaxID=103429 RepID=UPI0020C29028|nr:uncharacterized protein F4817DRAFT_310986 [Daldinia loculata]KAI1652109.1 hypothetical protein F4817DRAFT_310986 [Daldinia loculata]
MATRYGCTVYTDVHPRLAHAQRRRRRQQGNPLIKQLISSWTYCPLDLLSLIVAPEGEGPLRRSRGHGRLMRRLEAEMRDLRELRELREELRTPRLGGPEVRLAIPTFSGNLFSFS